MHVDTLNLHVRLCTYKMYTIFYSKMNIYKEKNAYGSGMYSVGNWASRMGTHGFILCKSAMTINHVLQLCRSLTITINDAHQKNKCQSTNYQQTHSE